MTKCLSPHHTKERIKNPPMTKYVVTKFCYAKEYVMVIADSQEEAMLKANNNQGKIIPMPLEFNGYQPKENW